MKRGASRGDAKNVVLYPTALRAIPATVPAAFCVLRSVLWGALQTTTQTHAKMHTKIKRTKIKNRSKSSENRSQITQNRGLEGSWESLGEVLGPFCAPGLPQRRPSDEKFAQPPCVPYFWGPKNHRFSTFLRFLLTFFVVVFRRRVLDASDHQF